MNSQATHERVRVAGLVAPLVLVLFVVGWYQFSLVYIQRADDQLVASGNLAVYVPVQQVHGYLAALLDATYLAASAGLIVFAYSLAKLVRARSRRWRKPLRSGG
jgi:hypothetical protein